MYVFYPFLCWTHSRNHTFINDDAFVMLIYFHIVFTFTKNTYRSTKKKNKKEEEKKLLLGIHHQGNDATSLRVAFCTLTLRLKRTRP